MSLTIDFVHERTLLGAVDSYLKALVHVRPALVQRYEAVLESLCEAWLATGGANAVAALHVSWLATYLAAVPDRLTALLVCQDFYRWALTEQLLTTNPVAHLNAV